MFHKELEVVHVPLLLTPKPLSSGGYSGNAEIHELGKSESNLTHQCLSVVQVEVPFCREDEFSSILLQTLYKFSHNSRHCV